MNHRDESDGFAHPAALLDAYWLDHEEAGLGSCGPSCSVPDRSGRGTRAARYTMAGLATLTVILALALVLGEVP
ncbi:hypothetical protein ACE1OA_32940 [Streptomyces sp. JL2001]|uniref:hypothetical protein n=1 Tax=unclassified Streptomyces TaxID=2593676 RepID=UPI0033B699E5